ncbi:MAG: RNA-binding protein [Spirosomataceae bacterium]
MNIYVANVSYSTTDDDLKELFETYGEVSSAKIIIDKMTGRSRGFAFVEMPNDGEGLAAINALNEHAFMGRNLVVNEAAPREERPKREFKPRDNNYSRDNGGYGNRERRDNDRFNKRY